MLTVELHTNENDSGKYLSNNDFQLCHPDSADANLIRGGKAKSEILSYMIYPNKRTNPFDANWQFKIAELRSGQVVREGDEYWYAWVNPANPSVVGIVDRGEIDYIVPTTTPGVVNLFVRFGQEAGEYKQDGSSNGE